MYQLPFDSLWDDAVAQDMIARCEAKDIPLTVNRYINPEYVEEFEQVCNDKRFSAFVLYETANFLAYDGSDNCTCKEELVDQVCALHRGNEPELGHRKGESA